MLRTDSGLVFHHVGVACADIEAEAIRFEPLGYVAEGPVFADPLQGVRGIFLAGQSPRLELLEPLAGSDGGVLAPWLKQGIKLYHLAYETRSLSQSIEELRRDRAKLVVAPISAVAFGGREIAFLMLPNRMLIELIARE